MKKNELEIAVREIRKGPPHPIECLLRKPEQTDHSAPLDSPHYHNHIEFLFGLKECDVDAWVGGKWVRFGEGDLLILNAGTPHTFRHNLPQNSFICIKALPEVIYFSENPLYDVKYVAPFLQNNLVPFRFFSKAELSSGNVPEILVQMLLVWQEKAYGFEIMLKILFLQVFLWITCYNHKHNCTVWEPTADISLENIQLIQKSIDYINDNFSDITEADAAANVNLSYSYYSRLFRRVVGKNFNEYLTTVRVNEAERLLLSSKLSITEIGFATGFATSSHFIEKFKKYKNITPKQYRLRWGK